MCLIHVDAAGCTAWHTWPTTDIKGGTEGPMSFEEADTCLVGFSGRLLTILASDVVVECFAGPKQPM